MVWLLWGVAKLCCAAKVDWVVFVETWHIWLLGSRRWRLKFEVAHIWLVGHRWLRLLCEEIIGCYSIQLHVIHIHWPVLLALVESRWGSHSHLEAQRRSIKRHMRNRLCAASGYIFVYILDLIVFLVEPLIRHICCDWRFRIIVGVPFWVLLHPSTAIHRQSQSQVFFGSPTQLQRVRRPWVLLLGLVNVGEFMPLTIQVAQIWVFLNDLRLLFLDWMLIHGTGHLAYILTMRALTVVNIWIEVTILHRRHGSNWLLAPVQISWKDKLLPKFLVLPVRHPCSCWIAQNRERPCIAIWGLSWLCRLEVSRRDSGRWIPWFLWRPWRQV